MKTTDCQLSNDIIVNISLGLVLLFKYVMAMGHLAMVTLRGQMVMIISGEKYKLKVVAVDKKNMWISTDEDCASDVVLAVTLALVSVFQGS